MHMTIKKTLIAAATAAALGSLHTTASAADWVMLQGTEPVGTSSRAEVWGFIQTQYQKNTSDPNASNQYIPAKLVGPQLTSQEQFNVNRARIGVRGAGFPLDDKVNYFLLAEFGKNGITESSSGSTHVTDASITLNHIPGARIRTGLFKYPGAEEGLQAIHVFDYVNFSNVTNQLMLERFSSGFYGANVAPQTLPVQTSLNAFNRPVGAFRDVGVQVFDAFTLGTWEATYAVMIGNGNGLNFGDNDSNKDTYLYLAAEKVFSGTGLFREGLKFFAWSQDGKRSFNGDNAGAVEEYDRKRSGLGVKYFAKPFRATVEYMKGKGMIWNGPDKPSFALTTGSGNPNADDNGIFAEASGYYLDGGWYIPNSNWELDLRYDIYHRLEGRTNELEFKTITYGAQYHFNRKTRVAINYEDISATAVNFGALAGPNANLDGVSGVYSVQLTHIF